MRSFRCCLCYLLAALALFTLTSCKKQYAAPALDPGDLTILCLGDSITAGTHGAGDDGDLSYPGILASNLHGLRPTIQVIDEGQDGWQVSDVAEHVQPWLQPIPPDIILLQIGTNDLEQGATPQVTANRLDVLVTQIEELAPAAHLYVANCTPVRVDNRPNLSLVILQQFNDLVPKIVRDHDGKGHFIVFVDLYKRADMHDDDFGPDGEHPNDSGYEKMAEYWSWILERHELGALRKI